MRKIIVGLILLSFCFAGNANIRESLSGASTYDGRDFLCMTATNVPAYTGVTPSALVWYADNIKGYSSIGINGFEATSGNIPTTISAQAVYPNGDSVSVSAQTITSGTNLTVLHSPWYKFTLPAASVTRNISFIFNIAD